MASTSILLLWLWLWLACSGRVNAQTIIPTNTTDDPRYGVGIQIALSHGRTDDAPVAVYPLIPLTHAAGRDIPNNALTGPILLANASNQFTIAPDEIALISCDPYSGNIQPSNVFATAESSNATAIVFYSLYSQTCHAANFDSYRWIYTIRGSNYSIDLLDMAKRMDPGPSSPPFAMIAGRDAIANAMGQRQNSTNEGGEGRGPPNPLGPSPSTAVAMIILYSITGVITALFLVIIVTGAVRAHRHPERYGPRNIMGRPRQTRARGLARAMLDSLPIVKFGEREHQPPKPTDLELESGQHDTVEHIADKNVGQETSETTAAERHTTDAESQDTTRDNGIAAAANPHPTTQDDENQGCSICTEDFEVGHDQRVLPCDHRFHPACIDPWLLNVSGTCPLCRIDLRPSEDPEAPESDEHVNPGDELAPPLNGDHRRPSVRRSLMVGIMGISRPERMTRDERLEALRQYREQNMRRLANRSGQPTQDAPVTADEETSRRRRLRNVFRIRTRRAGEGERAAEEPAQPTPPPSAHVRADAPDAPDSGAAAVGDSTPVRT